MRDKTIVGFLDILGYDKLVEKMIGETGFIKHFDDLMYEITLNKLNLLRNSKPPSEIDEDHFKEILNAIKVRCIYDNIIFSLPLSGIRFSSQKYDKETIALHCIENFFLYMALVTTLFISEVKHLLRGGISIGSHYESERDNYLFIFSEAHNQAVKLENKDTNKYPRILLDDKLRDYLISKSFSHIDKFFYTDEAGLYCFDIYSILSDCDKQQIIQTLTKIRDGLNYHLERNFKDKDKEKEYEKVLSKLMYFAKYHNRKIIDGTLNFPDLVIDINKYKDNRS